jgi:hypothetical protein
MLATDTVANLVRLYRATPTALATNWTWSAALFTQAEGSTAFVTTLMHDANYIYLCEYGDPVGGPSLYRSADGVTWTTIYTETTQAIKQRHMHSAAPDPFTPGHVWMTLEDANADREIMRSKDYGATWSVVEPRSEWQAVQISFTRDHVWFAGDSDRGHVFTIDKATGTKSWACAGLARNLAVPQPAALTDKFYHNGFYGCVDPSTGVYYFSLQQDGAGGNTPGLFAVLYRGAQPILLSKLASASVPVEVFSGWVWCGPVRKRLLGGAF